MKRPAPSRSEVAPESDLELSKLVEELHLHKAELEMQNDELRIANEKLELQKLKFAGVYDMAPIGFYILDKSGKVTDVNQAGVHILQTSKERLLNNQLQKFIAPEYNDAYHQFFRKMISSGEKTTCHVKMISSRGNEFYGHIEGIAVTISRALPLQCDIAVIDISDRILTENSLARTKERLELALEASSSGTWELDLDTMVICVDEFNHEICGIPGGRFEGAYPAFLKLIHADDRAMVNRQLRSSINTGEEVDVVCRFENKIVNTCYVNMRGHVISQTSHSRRYVGIISDISEKKRVEEDTLRLKEDRDKVIARATLNAEQSERTRLSESLHDSLSQLLYGIRIHLATILKAKDPAKVLKTITELLDSAVRETRNISFELAPATLTDFGLPVAIEELSNRLTSQQMKIQTRFIRITDRFNHEFEANIFRIVQELVNNCLKHSGANLVNIELKREQFLEITVTDNGSGFQMEEQEKKPSGAGLSSIKKRLSLYNGQLDVQTNPGGGTAVTIRFEDTVLV